LTSNGTKYNRFKYETLTLQALQRKRTTKVFNQLKSSSFVRIMSSLAHGLFSSNRLLSPVIKLSLLTFIMFSNPIWGDEARADFRVCNGTQSLVGVAIGYRTAEGWVSEGWWQVQPTSCETLIKGKIESRFYYVYAEDAAGGGRWGGDINMCVSDTEFKIVGVEDCFARGFQRMGFKEYDTGRQGSWMVQLTDGQEQQGTPTQ
jgi:uncharacterized membrane protein